MLRLLERHRSRCRRAQRPTVGRATSDATTAASKPSFALRRPGEEPRVRFAGLPMGHEFTSLVLALLQVGGHPPKIDPALHRTDARPRRRLHFETFISLTCQNCPDVVQALNVMAVLNPRIRHTMIDGALFPGRGRAARDHGGADRVPERRAVRPGPHGARGDPREARYAARPRARRERSRAKAPYDVLVVGGGPAGAAAAIYAARKGIRTGVVAERFGGQVLDTVGIENFISVKETEGHKLAAGSSST